MSDDLLLVAPWGGFIAILDNNGVPRYHRDVTATIFQRHADGPTVDGRQVRYSVMINDGQDDEVELLDDNLDKIRTVQTVAPLTSTDHHDFTITEGGHLLFVSFPTRTRDYSAYFDEDGNSYSSEEEVKDSVIQEVSTSGVERFRWNSWDFVQLEPDCRRGSFTGDYAHLNSLQAIDGDIVASLPGCNQVVRIDRSAKHRDGRPPQNAGRLQRAAGRPQHAAGPHRGNDGDAGWPRSVLARRVRPDA